jgi:hypothetical protein
LSTFSISTFNRLGFFGFLILFIEGMRTIFLVLVSFLVLADVDPHVGAGPALNDRLSGQIWGAGRLRIGSTSSSCGVDLVCIERLVHAGNKIFLDDQLQILGDTTLCCAKPKEERELTPTGTL